MDKNIAFVWISFELGGSEQVCYNTAKYLRTKGVKSYFFGRYATEHARQYIANVGGEFYTLPEDNKSIMFMSPSNVDFLAHHIKSLAIDLVFFSAGWIHTLDVRDREKLPCKVSFWHHFEPLEDCKSRLLRSLARSKRSWGGLLEYYLVTKMKYHYFPFKRRDMERNYLEQIRLSDYYLVLCPEYKARVVQQLGLNHEEANKILPMINTQERVEKPQLAKGKEIIYMGRLDKGQKCVDRLLYIWQMVQKSLPEWQFKIYGSGSDETYLKELALRLNLERCHFMGRIQYPEQAYRDAAILCLSSNYEGYPMVLVEAQNHGVVPMCFDICAGVRHIIGVDERAGRLVRPFDLEEYAIKLVELCLDPKLREELQQSCLSKVSDYTLTINDANWARLLGV